MLDAGARGATVTFAERGIGDVLIAWENEAHLALQEFGADKFEIVYPSSSILAEPPVALVDKVVDKRGTRKVAQAYLEYLYSPAGQEIVAQQLLSADRPQGRGAARGAVPEDRAVHDRRGLRRLGEGAEDALRRRRRVRPDLQREVTIAAPAATASAQMLGERLANEQRAARPVRRRIDDEQRARDTVVGEARDRQRLLRLDDDLADVVDAERIGRVGGERRDVETAVDRGDAALQPAVAVAQPVLAADDGRLVVEPGQRRAKAGARRDASRRGEPVAARDVELAVEDDARRATGADLRRRDAPAACSSATRATSPLGKTTSSAPSATSPRATRPQSTRGRWPAPLVAALATNCTGTSVDALGRVDVFGQLLEQLRAASARRRRRRACSVG